MSKKEKTIISIAVVLFLVCFIFYATPEGRGLINTYFFQVQKVDDRTNYQTIKKVEDTARSMIASYESDKLVYEQYKGSDNEEKASWGEGARMRANKTAATYNNYILENSFIWEDNIPEDIKEKLEYIN